MRVLLVHNYYQQAGGEEQVFVAEGALLEAHGHRVVRYTSHNDRVTGMSRAVLAKNTVWNRTTYRDLRTLIRKERPQVAHFHNTFPLISPAAYYAARAEGVPTAQTLHNYRLLCPNALFFREGRACEDCVGQAGPWPEVIHACYRGSHLSSGGVAAMLTSHRILGTWVRAVDAYITLTEYTRRKFIQGGLPAEKIVVKPNFVYPDPGPGAGRGMYALFVGRLSREKGVDTLLAAWNTLQSKYAPQGSRRWATRSQGSGSRAAFKRGAVAGETIPRAGANFDERGQSINLSLHMVRGIPHGHRRSVRDGSSSNCQQSRECVDSDR
jgi:glycosyltransferase involved in cell wall biosynthesis